MPFQIIGIWLRGIISLAIIGAAIFLFSQWYTHRQHVVVERVPVTASANDAADNPDVRAPDDASVEHERVVGWQFGFNRETAYLLGSLALAGLSLGGRWVLSPVLWRHRGKNEPREENGQNTRRLARPDGSELSVAAYGPSDADPVVFVHGWGLDSNEWFYAKRELGAYRLITWDLPGLGRSTRPADRDWSLEKLAQHLDAVIRVAGDKPVALVGHSIGVMIILTYCRLFPEALGQQVRSLVLAQGTYTNPVRTTSKAWLYTALQKPVLEPLCHLMIWLSPVVRVLNWLSYFNGSAHRSTERSSFSGKETRGQLDFLTRYYCKSPPDVTGRGMLAMFRYDATGVLPRINVPTLLVGGDLDKTCLLEASQYMTDTIPNAELVVLSSARHCGLFEHHEEFHEHVVGFLAENETRLPDVPTDTGRSARVPS